MSKKIIIPRDFLDDEEDSYVANIDPQITNEELSDLPINISSLDISKLPLQFQTPKEWKSAIQLIDPLHLPGVYNILSLLLTHTWEYEEKTTQDKTKLQPNPAICIEVLPNSQLHQFFLFPVTEVITSQIFPLLGILVLKSHRKIGYERFEYRLRLGPKPLRVQDVLRLMSDINLLYSLPDAISTDEIASRLFLALLTTMLQRHRFIPPPIRVLNHDDADNDECIDTEENISAQKQHQNLIIQDFNDLWFEMSNFQVNINYSTKFTLPLPSLPLPLTTSSSDTLTGSIPTGQRLFHLDFTNVDQLATYFSTRQEQLYIEILNSIVINYERNVISLTVPCVDYAIPSTIPTTTLFANFQTQSVSPKTSQNLPPLHLDVFLVLPNILIAVIKAIITFNIRRATNDLNAWNVHEMHQSIQSSTTAVSPGELGNNTSGNNATMSGSGLNTDKLMDKDIIMKYLDLFKVLMDSKQHYAPADLLSCWCNLTECSDEEFQPENLNEPKDALKKNNQSLASQFNKLIIDTTPTYLTAPIVKDTVQSTVNNNRTEDLINETAQNESTITPTSIASKVHVPTSNPTTQHPNNASMDENQHINAEYDQNEDHDEDYDDEADNVYDHLAQSISLSLAQQYVFNGFDLINRQFISNLHSK